MLIMKRFFILLVPALLLMIAVYFVWRNGYGAAEPIHSVELISGLVPEKIKTFGSTRSGASIRA